MDLAKIRKKFGQMTRSEPALSLTPDISETAAAVLPESSIAEPVPLSPDFFDAVVSSKPLRFSAPAPQSDIIAAYRNPLEIIMAGRKAAGCDQDCSDDDEPAGTLLQNYLEYLCFRVSDEIYGISIMDIKEIIKPREVTEIPRTPEFVSGIISLRGTIIPIIDMRSRLGMPLAKSTGKERIVVIKGDNSLSGLLVDEVIQVMRVKREDLEPAPSVLDGIDRDFVIGLGRSDGRMIIILNLESIADFNLY